MPYSRTKAQEECPICVCASNIQQITIQDDPYAQKIDCFRCGDFTLSGPAIDFCQLFLVTTKRRLHWQAT
jgi:hypothetical protein